MKKHQIRHLHRGDIITWQPQDKSWQAFGQIARNGSLFCDIIIGDGDGHIGQYDPFYSSEPGWVPLENIKVLKRTKYIWFRMNGLMAYHRFRIDGRRPRPYMPDTGWQSGYLVSKFGKSDR